MGSPSGPRAHPKDPIDRTDSALLAFALRDASRMHRGGPALALQAAGREYGQASWSRHWYTVHSMWYNVYGHGTRYMICCI